MTKDRTEQQGDLELWRRARAARDPVAPADDEEAAGLIAGYVEGTLDPRARERVESWLAADPEALDLLIAVRGDLKADPIEAPESLVERAQGLVRPRPRAEPSRGGLFERLFAPAQILWQPVGAMTAIAVLVACIAGFQLGRTGYSNTAIVDAAVTQEFAVDFTPGAEELL